MRYFKAILLLTSIFIVGATAGHLTDKNVESIDTVKSNDDLKSEVRNVQGFEGVDIGSTISATVTVGQNFNVVVEGREEILPKVVTTVVNNSLVVKFEKGFWKSNKNRTKNVRVNVKISLPILNDLDVSGASRANVSGVNSEKLIVDLSGASNATIEGNARQLDVDLSGASSLKAKNLFSEVAEMDLSGASSAKVNVTTKIRVDASGASSVRYLGTPQVTKDTSGASSISKL